VGDEAKKAAALKPGQAWCGEPALCTEEEAGDEISRQLASRWGDVYVNAFGTAHRAHAGTAGRVLPEGQTVLRMQAGSTAARCSAMLNVSDRHRGRQQGEQQDRGAGEPADKCDEVIIGGMANTFVKAQGGAVGASLVEDVLPWTPHAPS
jgi:phosphoglycerate kinase